MQASNQKEVALTSTPEMQTTHKIETSLDKK